MPYPFLVCVKNRYFTLVLSITLSQFFHFAGTFQYRIRNFGSSENSRQFPHGRFLIQALDHGPRLAFRRFFSDHKVHIRNCGEDG